jgi:hypothetical protein
MRTATKLIAYGVILAALFGSALVVGAAAGPIDVGAKNHNEPTPHNADVTPRQGVSIAAAGFRLEPLTVEVRAETAMPFQFRIVDEEGEALRRFELNHERELHLIVVSRNLIDYAHVHPIRDEPGTWSVDLPALPSGSYRVLADFRPAGSEAITLGADLSVTGAPRSVGLPAPALISRVDDYEITLGGAPNIGASDLTFEIRRNGEHVATEPYLGAAGHLVGIRAGDMAYLHVHPTDDDHGTSGAIRMTAEFPTAGSYRLFLDFKHQGVVRTAAFTVVVESNASHSEPTTRDTHGGH